MANCNKPDDLSYYLEVKKNMIESNISCIRYKGKYSDVGKCIGKIFKAVKNNGAGAPFNCYYDTEFREDADIEIFVPTTKLINDSSVSAKKLPAIKAICTTHMGSYVTLNLAYNALFERETLSECNLRGAA